jgi:hypothetical protein
MPNVGDEDVEETEAHSSAPAGPVQAGGCPREAVMHE